MKSKIFLFLLSISLVEGHLYGGWADDLTMQERFRLAIHDAKLAQPSEVIPKLTKVLPSNNYIVWGKGEHEGKVLVISVMDRDYLTYFLNVEAIEALEQGDDKLKAKSGDEFDLKNRINFNQKDLDYVVKNLNKQYASKNDFPAYTHIMREREVSWVSVVPDLRLFIREYEKNKTWRDEEHRHKTLQTRVIEYLGLQPDEVFLRAIQKNRPYLTESRKVIVEMWIDSKDLFRPSVDPEVFDGSAMTDIANATSTDIFSKRFLDADKKGEYDKPKKGPDNRYDWLKQADVDKDCEENRYCYWFTKEKEGKYVGVWAMPFGSLGYTYDYSVQAFNKTDQDRHLGISEFGVRPVSKATIHAIYSIDRYRDEQDRFLKENFKRMAEKIVARLERDIKEMFKKEGRSLDQQASRNMQEVVARAEQSQDAAAIVAVRRRAPWRLLKEVGELVKHKINAYNDYLFVKKEFFDKPTVFRKMLKLVSKKIGAVDRVRIEEKARDSVKQLLKFETILRRAVEIAK